MCTSAFSANGKDVIVDFPQQSHWTGLLSEMELVPSVHPGVRSENTNAAVPLLTAHWRHITEEHSLTLHPCGCVCRCDGCQMFPINGARFKCRNCDDFDFCENCFKTRKHNTRHSFGRINEPGQSRPRQDDIKSVAFLVCQILCVFVFACDGQASPQRSAAAQASSSRSITAASGGC